MSSHKETKYPFFTDKALVLARLYTVPRTSIGLDRYATYKDYGENTWKIGYGSTQLNGRWLKATDKCTREEIDEQFAKDLKEFSNSVRDYIFVPLNPNKRAAVISFAYSIGIQSFKTCHLRDLINSHASKSKIIREWSPYINAIWRCGGDSMVDRRRVELDTYLAADKEIPTFYKHRCQGKRCLLNLPETYTGAPNQVKAVEYLEKKILNWDPSGEVLRRFFRYWNEKPSGLGSPPRPKVDL